MEKTPLQRVLEDIERQLTEEMDIARAAEKAGMSEYHLRRFFALLTGQTLNDYIRQRKLTLAAADLRKGDKVIDVALRYGYESPDSFSRAFARFHGLPPSEIRKADVFLNACSPYHIKVSLEGGSMLDYQIVRKEGFFLLGFHRHFKGTPESKERFEQEDSLFRSTRAHQWMLRGLQDIVQPNCEYVALENVSDDGYEFWYGCTPDQWSFDHLYDPSVTGIDFMDRFGFATLCVPSGQYAVFKTPLTGKPVQEYEKLRLRIAEEFLPATGYRLKDAPEIAVYHWTAPKEREKRYIEIWLPIED